MEHIYTTDRCPSLIRDNGVIDHATMSFQTFGRQWPSLRLGLLSPVKHCALVNNYGDVDGTRETLMGPDHGCVSLADLAIESDFPMDEYQVPSPKAPTTTPRPQAEPQITPEYEDEDAKELPSLAAEAGKSRLILEDNLVLGGRNAASEMEQFVPTNALRGLEDVGEEAEYYESYLKVGFLFLCARVVLDFTLSLGRRVSP